MHLYYIYRGTALEGIQVIFFLHYLLEHPVCRLEPISKSMRFVGRHHTIN